VLLRGAEEYLPAEPARARDYALRAFLLLRMANDKESIATAADVAAQALYLTGDYSKSRRFAGAAYRIYRRCHNRKASCMILAILAGTALRLGRLGAALMYSQRSYAMAQEIGEPVLLTVALGNLSQALTAWGRYEEAVERIKASIGLMEQQHLTRNRNYVTALNTLALLYLHLNQDAEAEKLLRRGLALADEAGDAHMQSMLKSNLGLMRWRYRKWEEGLPLLQEALEIAHRNGDASTEGEISLNIARGLIELGQLDDALTVLLRALMLARLSQNRELEWLTVTAESRLLEKQNRLDEAARSAERALSIATEFGSEAQLMPAMHTLARSYILFGDYEHAVELLEQVVRMEETISQALRTDALLTSVFDVQVSAHEDLQWVQVKLGRLNDALVSAERGRARVLGRWIAERDAEKDSPPDYDEIRSIASKLNTTFLVLSLVRDPAYLFDREPEANAFIWVVPPDPAAPVTFHCWPSLREWATRMGTKFPSFNEVMTGVSDSDLQWMHDWFIAPVAHALPQDPSAVVTVVPIGPLAVMPLAAARDATGVSLIERHPIAMTPSIQTLRLSMNRDSDGEGALVIGDPGADLDFAKAEAKAIARGVEKRMPTSALIGRDATRDAVARLMPGKRLVHFASHAVYDSGDEASYYGALILGDGRLTAEEIRAMPLHSELVVLSACDTGQGRIAADGVLGLSRSFILAGARSVVATLWKIPDAATRLLIEHFYERIDAHGHKARALQEAMLYVKKMPEFARPYYWAGFVLIGDPSFFTDRSFASHGDSGPAES